MTSTSLYGRFHTNECLCLDIHRFCSLDNWLCNPISENWQLKIWLHSTRAGLDTHNNKTHISPLHNGCTCQLMSSGRYWKLYPGYFWCGLFLNLIEHVWVLKWYLNCLDKQHLTVNHYTIEQWGWLWIWLPCVIHAAR